MSFPDAILFAYEGTLVTAGGQARAPVPQPGVHAALRQIQGRSRLALLTAIPADELRADLARLALADFFELVVSRAEIPGDPIAHTLGRLGVRPDRAAYVGTAAACAALPRAHHRLPRACYAGDETSAARLRALFVPSGVPIFTHFDQLPTLLDRLDRRALGQSEPLPAAARFGGLLLGFALGTATMLYLWQREAREMETWGETVNDE